MLEKYYKYKLDYREYVLLMKFGIFYECIDRDAFILHKIMKYRLKRLGNTYKVGFPIGSIDKVIKYLEYYKINYVVINDIVDMVKKFRKNNYNKYLENYDDVDIIGRVDSVIKKLENYQENPEFISKLEMIESILD